MKRKLLIPCLILSVAAVITAGRVSAQTAPEGSGIFMRANQVQLWKQMVPGLHYAPDKDMEVKFGDVMATREKPLVLKLADGVLTMMPYSVFRVQGSSEGGRVTVIPEILFGEALYNGPDAVVRLPGQTIRAHAIAYFVVDEEKYSSVAAVTGSAEALPEGASGPIILSAGNMLELGPSGETGTPEPLQQSDIDFYSTQKTPADAPKVVVAKDQEVIPLEPPVEVWTRERLAILKDGPESPAGLAIASGKTQQQVDTQPGESIQVFDQKKGPQQKTMTFSAAVAVEKKASDPPRITSLTIGKKKASPGDPVVLKPGNLDDRTFTVSGKAATSEADQWKLFIKVNGEESALDSVTSFEYTVRVALEFPKSPKITNVTIGEEQAASMKEDTILTRENLSSGRMAIAGAAEPGENFIKYNIDFVAKDSDGNETAVGSYQAEVDMTGIQRVEVSVDDGSSWEPAKGTSDWTYVFGPQNGETYKVRARAVDVIDLVSEEQMEPYIFKYSYKTDEEMLRETFETMMRAFTDKDRVTFLRSVSQDFRSNNEGLRDYNDLENSIKERFDCCVVNVKHTIREADANRQNKRGTVEFFWTMRGAVVTESNFALFHFAWEETGEWLLVDVVDPNTFLRPSRTPYSIVLTLEKTHITADGESTCNVTANVLDNAGSPVADNIEVTFQVDQGSISPTSIRTLDGYASAVFRSPTAPGTATVNVVSGSAASQATIVLDPIPPPLPPD